MGYLSNKKHAARTDAFLKIFLLLCAIISLFGFGNNAFSHFLNQYRWQACLLLTFVFIYTSIHRFYGYMICALLLAVINYFTVSSAVNIRSSVRENKDVPLLLFASNVSEPMYIFESAENKNAQILAVTNPQMKDFDLRTMIPEKYAFLHSNNGWEEGFILSKLPVKTSGRLSLGAGLNAEFAKVDYNNMFVMLIVVDFNNADFKSIKSALDNLSSFIARQDGPVVVFGNFNMTAWSRPMHRFLSRNGLSVKNAMLDNLRNIFIPQKYYIMSYEKNNTVGERLLYGSNRFRMFTRF